MVLVSATCSEFGIEYPLVSNHGKQSPIDHFPTKTLLDIMWNIPKRYLWSPTKKIAPDSDPFGSRTVQERMPEREGF